MTVCSIPFGFVLLAFHGSLGVLRIGWMDRGLMRGMRCSDPKSNESSAQAFSSCQSLPATGIRGSHFLLTQTMIPGPPLAPRISQVQINPFFTHPLKRHQNNASPLITISSHHQPTLPFLKQQQSIRKRPQIQPPHLQPKRVIPRVAPRGVQVQPAPHAVLEVDVGVHQPLVVFPLRPGEHVPEGGDDG